MIDYHNHKSVCSHLRHNPEKEQSVRNQIEHYLDQLGHSEIALLQKIMEQCDSDTQFGILFCEALRKK